MKSAIISIGILLYLILVYGSYFLDIPYIDIEKN